MMQNNDQYNNNYKNDKFLKAYADANGRFYAEELGFLRVFTTTSLFQRLTIRDKFSEDHVDIELFKKWTQAVRKDEKYKLDKFSAKLKDVPVYDCIPFYDIPIKSNEQYNETVAPSFGKKAVKQPSNLKKDKDLEDKTLTYLTCNRYFYEVTP